MFGSQHITQVILYQGRIAGIRNPVRLHILRQHEGNRKRVCIFIKPYAALAPRLFHQDSCGLLVRVKSIQNREQAVHQRGASCNAVCIGGTLTSQHPEEIGQGCICGGRKQGYGREIHPCAVIFRLPGDLFHPVKGGIADPFRQSHAGVIILYVAGPAGRGNARHRRIDRRFHRNDSQRQQDDEIPVDPLLIQTDQPRIGGKE